MKGCHFGSKFGVTFGRLVFWGKHFGRLVFWVFGGIKVLKYSA